MKTRTVDVLALASTFAFMAGSISVSLGAITGHFSGEPGCLVNGNMTHDFVLPGDFLAVSAATVVTVGAGDPATTFYQSMTISANSGQFVACNTSDDERVQPGGIDDTQCTLGYTVPQDYYNYYDVFTDLKYWDSATMTMIDLDTEYAWFNTN